MGATSEPAWNREQGRNLTFCCDLFVHLFGKILPPKWNIWHLRVINFYRYYRKTVLTCWDLYPEDDGGGRRSQDTMDQRLAPAGRRIQHGRYLANPTSQASIPSFCSSYLPSHFLPLMPSFYLQPTPGVYILENTPPPLGGGKKYQPMSFGGKNMKRRREKERKM